MNAATKLPRLAQDFTRDVSWGVLRNAFRRFEIVTPQQLVDETFIPRTVGCIHSARSSLLVRIGGGHLRAAGDELLRQLELNAASILSRNDMRPIDYVSAIVRWLEVETSGGLLENAYVTATLVVAISDSIVWTWSMSPHGVVRVDTCRATLVSTDLRYPILEQFGIRPPPVFSSGDAIRNAASSIFCIGAPAGYEEIETIVSGDAFALVLDRAMLPFSPWPSEPILMDSLWSTEGAWQHGIGGMGLAVGHLDGRQLKTPSDWRVRDVVFTHLDPESLAPESC
jgi:hypothetical protein